VEIKLTTRSTKFLQHEIQELMLQLLMQLDINMLDINMKAKCCSENLDINKVSGVMVSSCKNGISQK
jgi:hypothetical protein